MPSTQHIGKKLRRLQPPAPQRWRACNYTSEATKLISIQKEIREMLYQNRGCARVTYPDGMVVSRTGGLYNRTECIYLSKRTQFSVKNSPRGIIFSSDGGLTFPEGRAKAPCPSGATQSPMSHPLFHRGHNNVFFSKQNR